MAGAPGPCRLNADEEVQSIPRPRRVGRASTERRTHQPIVVGQASDPQEREADHVANEVVAAIRAGADLASSGIPLPDTASASRIRRAASTPAAPPTPAGRRVQRRAAVVGAEGGELDGDTASALRAQLGRGEALASTVRSTMESAFGADLSSVRIHRNAAAADLSRSMSASAFTVGTNVFLGDGCADLNAAPGQRQLAHELAHVVQDDSAHSNARPTVVRRLFVNHATKKGFNLAGHGKVFYDVTLNAQQRAVADRLWNDPYEIYEFDSLLDAMKWVQNRNGLIQPRAKTINPRPQQGGAVQQGDPFASAYDVQGQGGAMIDQLKVDDFLVPRFRESVSHASNWGQFVDMLFAAIHKALTAAGVGQQLHDNVETQFRVKALGYADVLDRVESPAMSALTLGTTNTSLTHALKSLNGVLSHTITQLNAHLGQHYKLATKIALRPSIPVWGPMIAGGMGSKVTMGFRPGGSFAVGSKADSSADIPWKGVIGRRLVFDRSKTGYVFGHLLNDNIGGPAQPYNLVPLTHEANAIHINQVEKFVKIKYLEMLREQEFLKTGMTGNPITEIHYEVEAIPYTGERDNTKKWRRALEEYQVLLKDLRSNANKGVPKAYNTAIDTFVDFNSDVRAGLAPAFAGLITDNKWEWLLRAMTCVQSLSEKITLDVMEARMQTMVQLWQDEDRLVPSHLKCVYRTVRANLKEDKDSSFDGPVSNLLEQMPFEQPARLT
jgi:hypothetical protein